MDSHPSNTQGVSTAYTYSVDETPCDFDVQKWNLVIQGLIHFANSDIIPSNSTERSDLPLRLH